MFKFFKSSDYFNFMGIHKICFIISVCVILLSIVSFFVNKLSFGIDFTGGLLFDITVKDNKDIADLRNNFLKNNFKDFNIQSYGDNGFIIRMSEKEIMLNSNENTNQTESVKMIKNMINTFFNGDVRYNKIDFVGPQIGKELIIKGLIALVLSLIVIMLYIWIRFEFEFGLGALITLFHDVIIVFGIYSIFGIEFDLTSIAAILTVVGYSINDTVVIYDRIREFLPKYKKEGMTAVINRSLSTTLRRTLLTSSTTLLSLLILVILGGESIKNFSFMVFIGIIIGTYSSIYISAPILLYVGVNSKKLKQS
ncbi:MAG TPA: protein translocase subunit SecF [Rickettsiales bacterium]|nr:protein translocase subunit SecF [Rickettsiales bacterium]